MTDTKKIIATTNTKCAGVYAITSQNEILYIGSGIELGDRLTNHRCNLKTGKYSHTKKKYILQNAFDNEVLYFTVLHESEYSSKEIKNMSNDDRENLEHALSVLEQMYIELYKPICNTQMKVTKIFGYCTPEQTLQRSIQNRGNRNPNSKYSEELIQNIIWLKNNNVKQSRIIEMLENQNVHMSQSYISNLGVRRWIELDEKKPSWFVEV